MGVPWRRLAPVAVVLSACGSQPAPTSGDGAGGPAPELASIAALSVASGDGTALIVGTGGAGLVVDADAEPIGQVDLAELETPSALPFADGFAVSGSTCVERDEVGQCLRFELALLLLDGDGAERRRIIIGEFNVDDDVPQVGPVVGDRLLLRSLTDGVVALDREGEEAARLGEKINVCPVGEDLFTISLEGANLLDPEPTPPQAPVRLVVEQVDADGQPQSVPNGVLDTTFEQGAFAQCAPGGFATNVRQLPPEHLWSPSRGWYQAPEPEIDAAEVVANATTSSGRVYFLTSNGDLVANPDPAGAEPLTVRAPAAALARSGSSPPSLVVADDGDPQVVCLTATPPPFDSPATSTGDGPHGCDVGGMRG